MNAFPFVFDRINRRFMRGRGYFFIIYAILWRTICFGWDYKYLTFVLDIRREWQRYTRIGLIKIERETGFTSLQAVHPRIAKSLSVQDSPSTRFAFSVNWGSRVTQVTQETRLLFLFHFRGRSLPRATVSTAQARCLLDTLYYTQYN